MDIFRYIKSFNRKYPDIKDKVKTVFEKKNGTENFTVFVDSEVDFISVEKPDDDSETEFNDDIIEAIIHALFEYWKTEAEGV